MDLPPLLEQTSVDFWLTPLPLFLSTQLMNAPLKKILDTRLLSHFLPPRLLLGQKSRKLLIFKYDSSSLRTYQSDYSITNLIQVIELLNDFCELEAKNFDRSILTTHKQYYCKVMITQFWVWKIKTSGNRETLVVPSVDSVQKRGTI